MSKFIKLSAGFMAAAMFVSCSNDVLTEEGVNTDGNKPVGISNDGLYGIDFGSSILRLGRAPQI